MIENKKGENNPVTRLYELLVEARKHPGQNAIRYVWADVLDIPRDDEEAILRAIVDLIWLVDKAKESIKRLEDVNRDDYIGVFENIDKVIYNLNLNTKWSSFQGHLTDTTMQALKFASRSAKHELGTDLISEEDLEEIKRDTIDIKTRIEELDFNSNDLKALINNYLDGIIQSINLYKIKGDQGLRIALENTIGGLILHKEIINDEIKDNENQRTLFRRIISVLGDISQVASFSIQVAQLTGMIYPQLGSGL